MKTLFEVEFRLRDRITVYEKDDGSTFLRAEGCEELLTTLERLRKTQGEKISAWILSSPQTHSEFLIRKLIYLIQGVQSPYPHEELCHCRMVPTQRVEDAIFNGSSDVETLRRVTTAATSCGTCTPDLESLLTFWKK